MVNNALRLVSAALAMPQPIFPDEFAECQAVVTYLNDRFGSPDITPVSINNWKESYEKDVRGGCSKRWADISISYLEKLTERLGGMENATADKLNDYLAEIAASKSPGTRNRTHNAFARFFNWAIITKRLRNNPLTAIKRVPEQLRADIVYCTPDEKEEIIELARQTGWDDWLAIPVGFSPG
ncbi:MAG: hypothetical protein LUG50_13405 [Planctomycetaceae bacterium]|nr:hypothetical protein [Planctomycetaceae bacterium]